MDRWIVSGLFAIAMAIGSWAWSSTNDRLVAAESRLSVTREELVQERVLRDAQYTILVTNIARIEKQVDNVHALLMQLSRR